MGESRLRGVLIAAAGLALACSLPLAANAQHDEESGAAVRGAEPERGVPDVQIATLGKLRSRASGPTDVTFVNGFPRLVETSVKVPGDTPAQRATAYVSRYRGLYAQFMADPFRAADYDPNPLPDANPADRLGQFDRTMRRYQGERTSTPHLDLSIRTTASPDPQVVALSQTYKGIPVLGADLLVLLDGRRVTGSVGGLLSDLEIGIRPTVEQAEAEDQARRQLELGGPDTTPAVGQTRLVVFAPELLAGLPRAIGPEPQLAWQIALGGPEPYSAVVGADTGELLLSSPGIRGHDGLDDYDLDLETANGNNAQNSGCYWWTGDNDTLGDEDGLNADGQADPEAVELWNDAKQAYKFFHDKYGRHSYDNDGGQFELYVDAGVPNAGWVAGSGDCDLIEFNDGWVEFDVLIHELTHALGDYALLGEPTYANQSGALDESHADTMAARADGNWDIGEGVPGGAIRDMSNPPGDTNQFGDPDRMAEFLVTSADNGGVHTNSGIANKASFLIAAGGTHPDTGVQVTGIGKPRMGWLTYMTIMLMPPTASFVDNRGLMVALADAHYSQHQACQVRNAYFAVQIGNPDTNCDGNEDDPDIDDDGVPVGQDNCPGNANPSQNDTDGDGKGDVCDGDADEDGVFWPNDNCPNVENPDQTDANLNGKGKACDPTEDDDFDDDGVLNPDDNCFLDPNPEQEDVDSDGDGDACDPDTDGDGWSNDDDNAPFEPNPGQEDADGDGIGDVSDGCPTTEDENVAWTFGNPDLGIDPKPLQPDSDGDGTPDACDRSVLVSGRLTAVGNFVRPDGRTRQVTVQVPPGAHLKVPISVARKPSSSGWFSDRSRRKLELAGLDRGIKAWITDDGGRSVAEAQPKASERRRRLDFRPIGGERYFLFLFVSERYDGTGMERFKAEMTPDTVRVRWPKPPRARR